MSRYNRSSSPTGREPLAVCMCVASWLHVVAEVVLLRIYRSSMMPFDSHIPLCRRRVRGLEGPTKYEVNGGVNNNHNANYTDKPVWLSGCWGFRTRKFWVIITRLGLLYLTLPLPLATTLSPVQAGLPRHGNISFGPWCTLLAFSCKTLTVIFSARGSVMTPAELSFRSAWISMVAAAQMINLPEKKTRTHTRTPQNKQAKQRV